MLVLLVISLLPVMYLGRYNHPTGDDYYYGAETHLVWQETGSILETVAEAARGVALEYGRWQGTYSALFLMYLPPNVFGNLPYRFVAAVILSLLTGGIFYFCRQVLCRCLRLSAAAWVMVSSCLTLLCVETVPSQGETFFWYNGSMYYTGYFAVTLFFLGLALKYMEKGGKLRLALLLLLALFLAGGNYVSLLPGLLLTVLLAAWMLCRKKPQRWGIAAAALAMLAGLVVSAAAPGNRVRQDGMWKIPAWKAVIKSLVQGFRYMGAWTGVWWLLAALLVTPVLWKQFRKCKFRFPYPLLVAGFLYGFFCSMSCPTFYTMNSTGPARAVAVVYYGFVLFSFAAYGYLVGYAQRVWRERQKAGVCLEQETAEAQRERWKPGAWKRGLRWGIPAASAVLLAIQMVSGAVSDCTTGKAVWLLASGEAKAYEQEYRERYRRFTDGSEQELVLQPYVNQPDMLYVGDFSSDPQEPTNVQLARFFGKASVRVAYD